MNESDFLMTSQYRRFVEFCEYCRDNKYIGLCYGKPCVGKTESARQFSNWNAIEKLLLAPPRVRQVPEQIAACTTMFLTPDVNVTAKRLEKSLKHLRNRFDELVDQSISWHQPNLWKEKRQSKHVQLLIVDESERLKFPCLELLRDIYDRGQGAVGIVLMGMPGIERRIKCFGQLYSRVHLAYEFEALSADETKMVVMQKWNQLGLPHSADDGVSSAILRIANGNFRVLNRIFIEIDRLQKLNCLPLITPDLIDAAREGLLLGAA